MLMVRTVCLSWKGLVQHLSLLQADGEAEGLGCIREVVDSSSVMSSSGFRVFEETPKVEETAVCSETNVHAVWAVLFCLMEHDAEEDGEQCGGPERIPA